MSNTEQRSIAREWIGHDVIDNDGSKIGSIVEIYIDDDSGLPEWVAIKTGWFGHKLSFAPLAGATSRGEDMYLPLSKDKVKNAPKIDPDGGLDMSEEDELYRYYGRQPTVAGGEPYAAEADVAGETMTRSEEQLRVDKVSRERGRARLRKYVVTEDVTLTVPIQREEVRVVREPISEADRETVTTSGELREQDQEVVLHEEEVRAHKEVVPKERVRLEKDVATEEREVSEELRKERIEVDEGDSGRSRDR